jgi:hypothetical protein
MKYEVAWVKTYYYTGTEIVEATSEEHAEQLAEQRVKAMKTMADFNGDMQCDPNETEVTVLGEIE